MNLIFVDFPVYFKHALAESASLARNRHEVFKLFSKNFTFSKLIFNKVILVGWMGRSQY